MLVENSISRMRHSRFYLFFFAKIVLMHDQFVKKKHQLFKRRNIDLNAGPSFIYRYTCLNVSVYLSSLWLEWSLKTWVPWRWFQSKL